MPGMQGQAKADDSGVPPVVPLADAKADALKGDKATMERMGEKLGSVKRTEHWDRALDSIKKQRALDAAVDEFEKQKRKELGL